MSWSIRVYAAGHGQWAFTAGPRSGTGYASKAEAQQAAERALQKALNRSPKDAAKGKHSLDIQK